VYKRGRGCQAENQVEFDDFGYKPFSFKEIFEMIDIMQPEVILGLAEEPRETYFDGAKSLKRSAIKALSFMIALLDHLKQSDLKAKVFYPIWFTENVEILDL
jgi:hypothetical protein